MIASVHVIIGQVAQTAMANNDLAPYILIRNATGLLPHNRHCCDSYGQFVADDTQNNRPLRSALFVKNPQPNIPSMPNAKFFDEARSNGHIIPIGGEKKFWLGQVTKLGVHRNTLIAKYGWTNTELTQLGF